MSEATNLGSSPELNPEEPIERTSGCSRPFRTLRGRPCAGQALAAVASAALALLGGSAALAQDSATEERLKRIEQELETLRKENIELRAQLNGSGGGPALVRAAGKEQKISLGGMLQTQAEFGNSPDGRFTSSRDRFLVRRARLNISGSFLEHFTWRMEGDFGAGSLNEGTDYRVSATDVFINWGRYDFANIRVGQFRTPFGYEQLASESTLWTAERSLANDRMTLGREVGAMVKGDFYTGRLGYSVGAFNGTLSNNSFNDNERMAYVGRINGTPWKGRIWDLESAWTMGMNAYATQDGTANRSSTVSVKGYGFTADGFAGDRRAWGVDTQFKLGPVELAGEFFGATFKPSNQVPVQHVDATGFTAGGAVYLLPRKVQAVVRYESFDPETDTIGNAGDEWVFGVNYYIKGNDLKLQLNHLHGHPAGSPDTQDRVIGRVQLLF